MGRSEFFIYSVSREDSVNDTVIPHLYYPKFVVFQIRLYEPESSNIEGEGTLSGDILRVPILVEPPKAFGHIYSRPSGISRPMYNFGLVVGNDYLYKFFLFCGVSGARLNHDDKVQFR